MRVLITGSQGFVGRHFVCKFLESDDHEIDGIDNLYSGLPTDLWAYWPRYAERFKFEQIDCRLAFRSKRYRPDDYDLVIHCAAIVGGRLTIEHDPLAVATDLSVDSEMFNWLVRSKHPPKLIYFSSSAVYPNELQQRDNHLALNEALQTFYSTRVGLPDMTYGWAKLTGEYLAKFAVEHYGVDVKIYRPFGGYGEDQDQNYPFPAIVKRVLEKRDPVVVWGSGDQRRDFIHIDDVVEGVLRTMHALRPGECLNLGTGRGVSFKELARMVCEICDHRAKIVVDQTKPEGVFARVSDPYKMELLFTPTIWLEQGIKRVVDHLQKTLVSA